MGSYLADYLKVTKQLYTIILIYLIMAVNIITQEDLSEFRYLLLNDLKELLQTNVPQHKKWLRSAEVRKLLHISPGTLQNLRINGTLSYTKVGGTIYYDYEAIEKMLNENKVNTSPTLFR